jgi:hypothetical protein
VGALTGECCRNDYDERKGSNIVANEVPKKVTVSAQLPVETLRQVYIELMFCPDGASATAKGRVILLAKASAFLYKVDGQMFLVTARHNFSGKHWETDEYLSQAYPAEPTHVAVAFRSAPPVGGYRQGEPAQMHQFLLPLIDESWKPVWREHPRYGASVDIAAIAFRIPEGFGALIVEGWDAEESGTRDVRTKLWMSENIAVVGYPYGLRGSFELPLAIPGSVSSEPALLHPYREREYPLFIVDAKTRTGQSGSAVVSVRQPFSPQFKPDGKTLEYLASPRWRLVGVYSGRVPEDYGAGQGSVFGAEVPTAEKPKVADEPPSKVSAKPRWTSSSDLGFVWRIEEATEICTSGVPGGTGPHDVNPADAPPRILGSPSKPID